MKFKITIDLTKCKTAADADEIIEARFKELRKQIADAGRSCFKKEDLCPACYAIRCACGCRLDTRLTYQEFLELETCCPVHGPQGFTILAEAETMKALERIPK